MRRVVLLLAVAAVVAALAVAPSLAVTREVSPNACKGPADEKSAKIFQQKGSAGGACDVKAGKP